MYINIYFYLYSISKVASSWFIKIFEYLSKLYTTQSKPATPDVNMAVNQYIIQVLKSNIGKIIVKNNSFLFVYLLYLIILHCKYFTWTMIILIHGL